MKPIFNYIFAMYLACLFLPATEGQLKIFGSLFSNIFSPCKGCPIKNCLNDKAVILGYCCGCARVSDFLPIDCPSLHFNCPTDGRKLCRDYDYMLNCCCP